MEAEKKVEIKNKTGLHARPAAIFVQKANKFDSEITVINGEERVNGKSIMGILMLAAGMGSVITIKAHGADAQVAVEELAQILGATEKDTFGEEI